MKQELNATVKISLWIDANQSLRQYKHILCETIDKAFGSHPKVDEVLQISILNAQEEAVINGHSEAYETIASALLDHVESNRCFYSENPNSLQELGRAAEALNIGMGSVDDFFPEPMDL